MNVKKTALFVKGTLDKLASCAGKNRRNRPHLGEQTVHPGSGTRIQIDLHGCTEPHASLY